MVSEGTVNDLLFSPDGRFLYSCGFKHGIQRHALCRKGANVELLTKATFDAKQYNVRMALSPSAKTLAVSSKDAHSAVCLLDPSTLQIQLKVHTENVDSVVLPSFCWFLS